MSELKMRTLSGIVAALIVLAATIFHTYSFCALLVLASIVATREWEGLNIKHSNGFRLLGFIYILLAVASLAWLRVHPLNTGDHLSDGPYWVLGLFALVWTTDIAAYVSGRLIGGPKIAPRISPNKTWAGLIGALIATAAMAGYLSHYPANIPLLLSIACGALLALVAQAGDFGESWLKRRAGLKDSGRIMPGHGGLLDRIDGLLAAAPLYAVMIYILTPA